MDSDQGKLFIGGISWETDEEKLREHFGIYGEVVQTVVMRDKTTGRPRGFGFVVFADPSILDRVLQEQHTIDGRTVEAKRALSREEQQTSSRSGFSGNARNSGGGGNMRTKKIFVGGLPATITEEGFRQYFESYGNVTDVVVMYDQQTQRPRGFGFISFDSEDAVDRVLHKTFHDLGGKQVEVKRALPKDTSVGGGGGGGGGGRSMGGSGGGGYQGFGGAGGNTASYDGRMGSNTYMNSQSTGGGFPSYGSAGYGTPGYGYGQASANMGYAGPTSGYGGPNYGSGQLGGPRSSWQSQGPTGYGPMGYGNAGSWGTSNASGVGGPVSAATGPSAVPASGYGNQGYGYGGYGGAEGSGYVDANGSLGYGNQGYGNQGWGSDSSQASGNYGVQNNGHHSGPAGYGSGYGRQAQQH